MKVLLILLFVSSSVFAQETVIYFVRHAEKSAGLDPVLTSAGINRAEQIAHMLKDAGITYIHSTQFNRTVQTAQPLAKMLGIEPSVYGHHRLRELADELVNTPGRHLVVGHSNTTAAMVKLLGGESVEIKESDYDRMYQLVLAGDKRVWTLFHTMSNEQTGRK